MFSARYTAAAREVHVEYRSRMTSATPAPLTRTLSATQHLPTPPHMAPSHSQPLWSHPPPPLSTSTTTPSSSLSSPSPSPWHRSAARSATAAASLTSPLLNGPTPPLPLIRPPSTPPPAPSSTASTPTSSASSASSASSISTTPSTSPPVSRSSSLSSSSSSSSFASNGSPSPWEEPSDTDGSHGFHPLAADESPTGQGGETHGHWQTPIKAGQRHRPRHLRGDGHDRGGSAHTSAPTVEEAEADDSAPEDGDDEAGDFHGGSGGGATPQESAAVRRKLRARTGRRRPWTAGRLLFDDAALARGRYTLRSWVGVTAALLTLAAVALWTGAAAALWQALIHSAVWGDSSSVLVRFPIPAAEVVDPVDHAGLLPTRPSIAGGNSTLPVFVIASCYNRLASLESCLPTWLALPEVTNVLIIDWASDKAVHQSLNSTIGHNDGRLRVVRLEHPSPFTLPTSVNLGLHFFPLDQPSLLLKVDCDTLLVPGFMEHHPISEDVYYAGDWRAARTENELHLNGVLFIHTQTFLAVNGYDERLQSYGYDDSNLHERLATKGLRQLPMRYDYIQHQWHDDSVRTLSDAINSKARKAALRVRDVNSLDTLRLEPLLAIASPFFATQRHRILLDAVPLWSPSMAGVQFAVRTNASIPHVYFTRLHTNIAPIETIASPGNQTHAINEAAQIALRRLGFQVDRLNSTLYHNSKYLMRLLTFYYTDSEAQSLVVDVQNGLSNRLRALASAAAVAAEWGLALKVIWTPDHHCQARFSDLFRIDYEVNASLPKDVSAVQKTLHALRAHLVWEDDEWSPMTHLLTTEKWDVYNYMEQQPGDVKDAPISPPVNERSLYVKSAYRLNSDVGYSDERLSQALSALVLAEPVLERLNLTEALQAGPVTAARAMVLLQPRNGLIGLHVRHQAPSTEMQSLKRSEYTHLAWLAMVEARNLTTIDAYGALLKAALKANPSQAFYLTTDTPSVIAEMRRRYGEGAVLSLSAEPCLDRSAVCVQRALADQLLLACSQRIFGSVWSSFSEVAGLWRRTPVDYPPEVHHRVEQLVERMRTLQAREAAAANSSSLAWTEEFRAAYISADLLAAGAQSVEVQSSALSASARASSCQLTRLSLLGERCSGTAYLQRLLEANFNLSITHDYHYKHFFGFEVDAHPLSEATCTLFVSIARHPVHWLDAFFKYQWQLDQWRYPTWQDFLTQPIISYVESEMNQTLSQLPEEERAAARQAELKRELWHDRNFAAADAPQWKDVFQLRSTKLRYQTFTYPARVQNYAFVRLEDLPQNYDAFLSIVAARFNVVRRSAGAFVDAEMDADVADVEAEMRGREHEHLPEHLLDFAWQHLDQPLEEALGYHRSNSTAAAATPTPPTTPPSQP